MVLNLDSAWRSLHFLPSTLVLLIFVYCWYLFLNNRLVTNLFCCYKIYWGGGGESGHLLHNLFPYCHGGTTNLNVYKYKCYKNWNIYNDNILVLYSGIYWKENKARNEQFTKEIHCNSETLLNFFQASNPLAYNMIYTTWTCIQARSHPLLPRYCYRHLRKNCECLHSLFSSV